MAAAAAGFDVIQAEKFTPAQIAALTSKSAVRRSGPASHAPRRGAGGVNASNAAAYAKAGADILVTSAPYLARPCDVQVHLMPAASLRESGTA